MSKRIERLALGAAAAFVVMFGLAIHPASALASLGSISGTVTSASSGAPIEDVSVCAWTEFAGNASEYCYSTGANGEYTTAELPAGAYRIKFSGGYSCTLGPTCVPQNYVTQYYDGKSSPDEAEEVVVSAGSVTSGIDAQMAEGGRITGIVIDASNETPLEAVEVCAQIGSENNMSHCSVTNGEGEYTIAGLASGAYKVEFARPTQCGSPCPTQEGFLAQFYNDKASASEASPVSVTAGSTTSGIDARLVEGGKISGVVTSAPAGAPIEGIDVCASGIDGSKGGRCASTDAAGGYTIEGLSSGFYNVMFFASQVCTATCPLQDYITQYYDEKSSSADAEPVFVTVENATTGIDARMAAGGRIAGKVTNSSGGAPIEGIQVCAFQRGEEVGGHCAATNADGEYTIDALPSGSYQVEFSAEGGYDCSPKCAHGYVSQDYNDKPSLAEAESVSVTAGSTTPEIDAAMVEGASQLLGPSHGPLANMLGGGPRPPVPVALPPASVSTPPKASEAVPLDVSAVDLIQGGEAAVKLSCQNTATCAGSLTLTAKAPVQRGPRKHGKTRTIAHGMFSVPARRTTTVRLALNGIGRTLFRAAHGFLKAKLTVVEASPGPVDRWTEGVELTRAR